MKNSEKILIILVIVFALISAYGLFQSYLTRSELKKANQIIKAQQLNDKIVAFTQLFIDKVLSGQKEVSFEDRLELENSVRAIEDQEIFNQWQKFVKGGTQDGQTNLSNLLKLLVRKISI